MHKTIIRTAFVATAITAAVATVAGGAVAAGGKAPLPGRSSAPEGSPLTAVASAYRSAYPQLSAAKARQVAAGQDARKELVASLASGPAAGTFGGAWFDAPSDTLHVASTTVAARAAVAAKARALGVTVTTHAVSRSFAQLEAQATSLRSGAGSLGRAATGSVGIDVQTNRVVAAVPAAQRAGLARTAVGGVSVVAKPAKEAVADAGCTARNACDFTIRAGAMLWRSSAGADVCSVGFTGRQTNNQRWVYTAGHCSNGNNVTWGTGSLPIGPMYASIDSGVYDAAIIKVTNSWFAGDQGGEIYKTVYVNGVAPTLGYMVVGETVCLSANYTNPTGGNSCGVIGSTSDAGTRGMVRVNGLDACGGDSGGGWYWLSSSGRRIAYGLHSRSDAGCHGDQGGTTSWFSPLPTVKTGWTPWLNVEVRP